MSLIRIRKIISIIIFVSFVMLFLGAEPLSSFLSNALLPFQFMPSLIHAIVQPEALCIAGVIFVVSITLIFGRVYCSFLCPLGTFQDIVISASRRFARPTGHSFLMPQNALRYTFLALTIAAAAAGFLSGVSLLDPYSLAGRFFAHFLQPLIIWIYNLGIFVLKPFDIYPYPKQTAFIPFSVLAATAGFFLLITYLAATRGRLYCNTVCPVGTFLGLISRVSLFRFTLNRTKCSECARCETVCKAGCIDPENASIDMSRCVGCLNCLAACTPATISYRRRRRQHRAATWSPARRGFIIGGIAAAAGLLTYQTNLRSFPGMSHALAHPPVTPPGSESMTHFTRACTACSLCVSICPTQVLTPAFLDYGVPGLLQPKMNYEESFCDYECNACGRVCPTGAITPVGLDEKQLIQIGEAKLLEDVCVVYVDHQNCGACGEVCPTHAIRFTDKKNILYPEIDKQYCIGCGACQLACPTSPRSIVVHAKPVHQKAEKYVDPEIAGEQKKSPDRDFPF